MNSKNKINVLSKISASMKIAVKKSLEISKQNPVATDNQTMRKNYETERKFWNEGGAVMFKSTEILVDKIRARIYYPSDKNSYEVIFFIHGGGFVVGSIDTHDRMMRNLAFYSDCAVVGIDYSLAPEAKFPTQITECDAVISHVLKNAKSYQINPKSVAYAGDSAGAYLAFATFLYQREQKDVSNVKAMGLFYGIYGLKDSASRTLYGNEIDYLRSEDIEYYYKEYLNDLSEFENPLVNIFNADLTTNIPPCFIIAAQFDPLKDDSLALFEILNNTSKYKEYKGVMHAFLHYSKVLNVADKAIKDASKFLAKKLKI